ncbi:glycosyltransferase [Patescibacteria group bacterium]|nr:glycosyltransferase [Patescibacteria group bacterium]
MNKNNLQISIIVVNFNGFELTKNLINSILKSDQKINKEIIVIDNHSPDKSGQALKKEFSKNKQVSVYFRDENDFLTAAYNYGFIKSKGKIVVFMNNDILVTNNWLKSISKELERENAGLVGVNMFSPDEKIDNLGCSLNILGYAKRIATGQFFKSNPKTSHLFFIPGSLIAANRDFFNQLGGFDESFLGNYEDVDLAWRTRLLNKNIKIAKKAKVYHLGSQTVKKYLKNYQSSFLCRKNRLATIIKNAGPLYLSLVLPVYLIFQIIIFLKELLFQKELALATPRALFWNIDNLEDLLIKRKAIQLTRKTSDWQIIKSMIFRKGTKNL